MGRTSKPLSLIVTQASMMDDPKIIDLINQGHTITCTLLPNETHILGPNCWRTLDLEYLEVTIAAIRKEVYEPTKPTRTDTDSKPVAKRHPRKSKRQVAVSPARSPESSGDGAEHNGGIVR